MSDFTITIVGTGVIGTSIGLALKKQDEPLRLVGHDKDLSNARSAEKMGAFDKTEWNLINATSQADLIILATPLSGIRPTMEAIAEDLKKNVVITDTTPNKVSTLAAAQELLPDHAHFIGGNPMVRPVGSGFKNASPDLFNQRLYCLTPSPAADEQAVQLMVGIVTMLGADPFFLDAAEHDGLAVAVEYLPQLLSLNLIQTLSKQNSWREIRKLGGGLLEQVSSGADGDPDSLAAGFRQNKTALIHWLDLYTTQLQELRSLVADEEISEEALVEYVDQAIVARTNWQTDYKKGQYDDPELETTKIETPGLLNQMVGFDSIRKRLSGSSKKK